MASAFKELSSSSLCLSAVSEEALITASIPAGAFPTPFWESLRAIAPATAPRAGAKFLCPLPPGTFRPGKYRAASLAASPRVARTS